MTPLLPAIPADINDLDRLAAARFYTDTLGWAVHPLNGPNKGSEKERGKKPLLSGWPQHRLAGISPEFIQSYFGSGCGNNLGCVVRPPFIHIDLDSKCDRGKSVDEWMAGMSELAQVPRERTGGGAHLVFICRNVPAEILAAKKAPSVAINDAVSAELYKDGLNIVLSPSVHSNGHRYTWEVTGTIPEVRWADIARWFGFGVEEPQRRGRPPKEKPWWSKWREDLHTLDLVKVMGDLGCLGGCVDPNQAKWAVACPWEHEHSGDKRGAGTDTVIFNKPENMPGFRCLHSHCEARAIRELVEWAEERQPGIIAEHCTALRVWEPASKNREGRPRIVLPGTGRPHGIFGLEIGTATAPHLDLFSFGNSIVEIAAVQVSTSEGAIPGHMLNPLTPTSLITAIERSVETGVVVNDEAGDQVFLPKSMSDHDSRVISVSRHFNGCLPRITRVLDVPAPLLDRDGKIIYPEPGYDERFGTWLNPEAPKLRTMDMDEAVDILTNELFTTPEKGGFWWHDEQARTHALARLVTPFCRGLMGWRRAPLWIYDGNREGCGKDTCADITHVLYTGRSIICAPLSKDCDEEMRKRITSALMAGSRFFHLANMKGHIRYASLEAATDNSGVWEDRRLGVSETLRLPNETEYSFSANNATWEPDIERRCRRIRLRFTPEDINGHRYKHLDIRGWVLRRRADLLSAINALVLAWVRAGMPPGPTGFTSFPEWGVTVGGIFGVCGLGDPCRPHEESNSSGDQNTRAMRRLFALSVDRYRDAEVPKKEYNTWAQSNEDVQELFDWLDLSCRRGMTSFGKLISRFEGRELGGITLHSKQTSKNRGIYQFFCDGGQTGPDLSLTVPKPDSPRGHGDMRGHFSHARIELKKFHESESTHNDDLFVPYNRASETSPHVPMSPRWRVITLRKGVEAVAADLRDAPTIALDLETYGPLKGDGLDPEKGDIRLLALCREGGPAHILDLRAIGYDLGPVRDLLSQTTVIAHNAKFDLGWLAVKCGIRPAAVFCTCTASRLLDAGSTLRHGLDTVLERHLGIKPGPDHSLSDWGALILTEDQLKYAAADVEHLHGIARVLRSKATAAGLDKVMDLEMALLPVVVDMEHTGVGIDIDLLNAIRAEAEATTRSAEAEVRALLDAPDLNLSSPKQLLAALNAAGFDLPNTAEETLKGAADESGVISALLRHRSAQKVAQQPATLLKAVGRDGRLRCSFNPTGTATGRFSSSSPNLQNIGRGAIRSAFTPAPGQCLIVADYSQIELRIAAVVAGDQKMLAAYQAGADLHRETAAAVLEKPLEEVAKGDRQLAKAVNFGLLYGQGAPGLVRYAAGSYGVDIEEEDAARIRALFFARYKGLSRWHSKAWEKARAKAAEVRTRLGRRRLIPPGASEWERFTALVNTEVQGGAADGMKLALVDLAHRLPTGAAIISTVHDEVIVEAPAELADQIRELTQTVMIDSMAGLYPEVPIEVEAHVCQHWGEK